jgi:sugar lactone lactonase YvrE
MATDTQGRLYVAGGGHIAILDQAGALIRDLELPDKARCVGVAPDGVVYAGLRDRVEVFDGKWQKRPSWQVQGRKPWLTGIAVGEKDVFVADSGNRVILKYDPSGKLLGRLGEKNADRNVPGLIVPSPYLDVSPGPDGLLRVNNPGRHRVELYTPDGDLELAWGKAGAGIESFCGCCNPIAIAMLPDGRSITCEKGLPRAKIFAADGAFECVIAGPESFPENARASAARDLSDGTMGGLDAAVDAKGHVYLLDMVTAEVRVFARKTNT